MINTIAKDNEVSLRGFLTAKKLKEASERITSIAALLKYEFVSITISTYGGDTAAIVAFIEAMKAIPIRFSFKIERAGLEGEHIVSALGGKS
jgi:hypothetical protein